MSDGLWSADHLCTFYKSGRPTAMIDLISPEALITLLQVVMIDLVLAGDNAIVIGLAAAGLPQQQRTRAILVGILDRDGVAHPVRRDHDAAAASYWPVACWRHSPPLGVLEDVARTAHLTG